MDQEKLTQVASQFIAANNLEIAPLGAGHINDSYRVRSSDGEYVMQRINHNIFKNVDELQNNIARVTKHIRTKLTEKGVTDVERRVLNLVPANDGKLYYNDDEGNYWRMMDYVKGSKSFDSITPALAEKAGEAFGEFQNMLADLPGGPLFETIPNFHNMEVRLAIFRRAVKNNVAGRLKGVKDLVAEIEKRAELMCFPELLHRAGRLPKRTNHCDTKVNNVLFDDDGEVLCVVDLDTVMPGYVLSDFGDFIRTGANNGDEDDTDLSRVSINLSIFEAYTKGYLKTASGFLSDVEKELLVFGAKMLTYMQTVRFLTDYIDGDKYYKIKSPKHNLERALAQFKLLLSMEENFAKMQEMVSKAAKNQV
jgi:Ser/Thr protein kinase RdoA (MazF antagonist)